MDVLLKRLGVSQRGLYPGVTEEPLDLLQGHPALESQGSGCVPEDVRSDVRRDIARSEERRVGKECRSRWSPYH